ncbi:MAG: SCO family protein [Pseudohongiellaceae bacterium]
MKTYKTLVVISLGVLFVIGAAAGLLQFSSTPSDEDLRELGLSIYPEPLVLNDFQLTDQRGNAASMDSLRGAWSLLFFGFTSCPDVCPLTLNELKQFYLELNPDYRQDTRVVLISVDPVTDTPEVMRKYLSGFHEDFTGLTGQYSEISGLSRQLYITHSGATSTDEHGNHSGVESVAHSAYIAILDPDGNYHSVIRPPHTDASLIAAYTALRDR